MTKTKAICVDRQFCSNPEFIGLENENLLAQDWLEVFESGACAREALRQRAEINEAWVVSCEDVEPVNLAAVLKKDRPELMVRLIVGQTNGSLCSRAAVACIDEVVELMRFAQLYATTKQHEMKMSGSLQEALGAPTHAEAAHTGTTSVNQSSLSSSYGSGDVPTPVGSMSVTPESTPTFPSQSSPAPASTSALTSAPTSTPTSTATSPSASASTSVPISPSTLAPALEPAPASSLAPESMQEDALSLSSAQSPHTHKGFLMSVVSGSGGAGKSSVAALAALCAAERGYRTLLIDLDLQFGDIASMMGSADTLGIDTLIADPERGRGVFSRQSSLAVLTAPTRLEMSEELVDKLPRLLDEAMRHFDVVIANTGANWAEQHALLLERSSVALFLLDQRSSSIRACHHALELCARCGIASVPFKFALNRCSKNAPFSAAEVSSVMQGAPIFELKDGGEEVEEYLASGHVRELRMQGNEFAKSIVRMMNKLLPQNESSSSQQPTAHTHVQEMGRRRVLFGRKRAKAVA